MPRGGSKPGERRGGRQKGSLNKRSREIANRVMKEGITPLEVMMRAMRFHYEAERWDEASKHAEKAAPYMHPKLQAVEHSGDKDNPVAHAFTWLPVQG